MKIRWFGHSAFELVTAQGKRLITDPYTPSEQLTYDPISEAADIVTISHDHWDHAGIGEIRGTPEVIRDVARREVHGVVIEGFPSYHDNQHGEARGDNIIFQVLADNLRTVHLGDLGAVPAQGVMDSLYGADILMIPVGGVYTIDPVVAHDMTRRIQPRMVIPMHYSNPKCSFLAYGADDFARYFGSDVDRCASLVLVPEDINRARGTRLCIMESIR